MNYIDEYISRIPMWASKKNDLKDVRSYLEALGDPDDDMKIIHVAGTNGKGSVCSFLTSVLTTAGYTVGTFISPHLEDIRERFLFNGGSISEDIFEQAFLRVRALADEMTERGFCPPTYFEFLFYMFIVMSSRIEPDYIILETGLGGRLDATNVVRNPLITVLTSISRDHTQYLGNTIEEIAGEKAGILKENVPVVYDADDPVSERVILERAGLLDCPAYPVSKDDIRLLGRDDEGAVIALKLLRGGELTLRVPSEAEYQLINVSVAVRTLDVLNDTGLCITGNDDIINGISTSYWPGRMERVMEDVYLDGAHNSGGIEALHETIYRMQAESGRDVSVMFGAVSDKDHALMIRDLCRDLRISHVTVARIDSSRSAEEGELADEFKQVLGCPVEEFSSVRGAWHRFIEVKGDSLAFCVGSLYLVGEVKTILREEKENDRL